MNQLFFFGFHVSCVNVLPVASIGVKGKSPESVSCTCYTPEVY